MSTATVPRDPDVCFAGGSIKATGNGKIAGWVLRFGKVDPAGDVFDPDGDYGPVDAPTRLLYDHNMKRDALGRALGPRRIGELKMTRHAEGFYGEGRLDLGVPGVDKLYSEILRDEHGFSTGSTERLTERKSLGRNKYLITSWPICEVSVTPIPAEKSNRVVAVKALSLQWARSNRTARKSMSTATLDRSAPDAADVEALREEFAFWPAFVKGLKLQAKGHTGLFDAHVKSTGLAELFDSEGGEILVPPAVRDRIWRTMISFKSMVLGHANMEGVAGNAWLSAAFVQEAASAGRHGFVTSIASEGSQLPTAVPPLRLVSRRLIKRVCYVPVTEELTEDIDVAGKLAPAVAEAFAHDISVDMLIGTGVGRPEGIVRSAACKQVAARVGQSAGALDAANVLDMWDALHADGRSRGVWWGSPGLERKFFNATTGAVDAAFADIIRLAQPSEAEYGMACPFTVLGRPYYASECMDAAGLTLVLADPQAIGFCAKIPGLDPLGTPQPAVPLTPNLTVSLYIGYSTDQGALKFVLRHNGASLWTGPRTLVSGAVAYPFVNYVPNT